MTALTIRGFTKKWPRIANQGSANHSSPASRHLWAQGWLKAQAQLCSEMSCLGTESENSPCPDGHWERTQAQALLRSPMYPSSALRALQTALEGSHSEEALLNGCFLLRVSFWGSHGCRLMCWKRPFSIVKKE